MTGARTRTEAAGGGLRGALGDMGVGRADVVRCGNTRQDRGAHRDGDAHKGEDGRAGSARVPGAHARVPRALPAPPRTWLSSGLRQKIPA